MEGFIGKMTCKLYLMNWHLKGFWDREEHSRLENRVKGEL